VFIGVHHFEQGLLGKKVNASLAPSSGTENADYLVQLWSTQNADGKKGPANAANTSANVHQGIQ
jgi:hypothetical protein